WIIFCLTYLEGVFIKTGISVLAGYVMLAVIIVMTSYFSLGISYKIEVGENGSILLKSFRRTVKTFAEDIPIIEGPHLPIGFIRFRLEREKGYLFYIAYNPAINAVLKKISRANPDINFKRLRGFKKL
ncbi:MAG: hypothetical protein HQ517_06895, partial [SAR324 cluster bacterium]|nr:hypothetical protein [SAR324 cluster bacterium]